VLSLVAQRQRAHALQHRRAVADLRLIDAGVNVVIIESRQHCTPDRPLIAFATDRQHRRPGPTDGYTGRAGSDSGVPNRVVAGDQLGAGGCHDHLWMSFYRPHTRRLEDVQITHRVSPDGFAVGLYVGAYATDLLAQAKERISAAPGTYLDHVNRLLEAEGWRFYTHRGSGENETRTVYEAPLDEVPDSVDGADGIYVRHYISRNETLALGPELVDRALDLVLDVWPLYRFYLADRDGQWGQ